MPLKPVNLDTIRQHLEEQQLIRDKQTSAACAQPGINPNLFFDIGSENNAKKICATCPLVTRCFDYALTNNEYGVWGNSTEKERAELRKIARRRKP